MMKFLFVIVSKDDKFLMPEECFSGFDNVKTEFISNNTENITKVYNRFFEKVKNGLFDVDFVVTMHSDVKLDVSNLLKHIEECSGKYDVMGLCGCEKVTVSASPLNWFTSSNFAPQFRWGCVTHGEDFGNKSFFSGDRSEIRDHHVGLIDGLCMIFSRKSIEKGLCFDENLGFNCYDTQISLDTLLTHRLSLGVIVEESLFHFSLGKQILDDGFFKDEIILRKRFGLGIPEGSKISRYIQDNGIQY